MKNPFFDVMRQPMTSPQKLVKLLQEQQLDTVETSVKALGCREPMSLVSLQQEYVARMLRRWTQLAADASAETGATAAAAASTAKAATELVAEATSRAERSALHDAADKATTGGTTPPSTAAATPGPATAAAPTAAASAAPASPAGGSDDLTQIKGIGPKFAQTLKDHGITTYAKLANLTPSEIEALEEKLGFSGRFERENWVEQARAMIAH